MIFCHYATVLDDNYVIDWVNNQRLEKQGIIIKTWEEFMKNEKWYKCLNIEIYNLGLVFCRYLYTCKEI
jgi:hypothetical protein